MQARAAGELDSPHAVMSITRCWGAKNVGTSQLLPPYLAAGSPQPVGFGADEFDDKSDGTLARGKNQIEIPFLENSVA